MKKQVISSLLAATMALTSLALPISETSGLVTSNSIEASATSYTYRNYNYSILDDGTIKIDKYTGTASSVSIPSNIGGKKVTKIGCGAFYDNVYIKSIVIPDSVTEIESGVPTNGNGSFAAFMNCTSLTSVTFGSGLTQIGDGAFFDCTSLKTVTIPSKVTSIGYRAFSGCVSLSSVTLNSALLTIGEGAFRDCTALKSIKIPSKVVSVDSDAFNGCTALTSVTIGSSVSTLGNSVFSGCTSLKTITIPKTVTSFGYRVFYNCNSSFVMKCYKDSIAETYAAENDVTYKLLDMSVSKVTVKSQYTSTTSSVKISWKKVSSASGYIVYRYNSSTKKWVKQKTIYGSSTTSYKQTGLKAGTTYKYRVKAFIERGDYKYKSAYSSTIKTSTKPAKVTMKSASKSKTAIRINWKKVTGASGYQVQRYNSSTKEWVTVKTIKSGSTLTYKQTGLKKGTTYKYRVRAYRVINGEKVYGAWSKTKKVTTKS